MELRIGDLIDVPPVRTVVRLADLADSSLRRHLVETFIFTGEVNFAIATILDSVAALKGKGFFVIGNFGSGKSHLLNALSLMLNDTDARSTFAASSLESAGPEKKIPGLLDEAARVKPLVVEISLVEHSNREYLEHIVLKETVSRLQKEAGGTSELLAGLTEMPRREAFQTIAGVIKNQHCGGLLLLLDELSEFLRSKENPRTYNEDVRFLQYLGEFAENLPAWIVATMQENIENTGSLAGELLHKIKDRYPIRFRLTGSHVKEIVAGRLIHRKDQAEEALPRIFEELKSTFDRLPFSQEDFNALYPVHPETVAMLDELRPLFSQHRGVVDFIHYRLAGDPGRGIEPFLAREQWELLTPDYIFDHFRERLRETVETNPYSDKVFHHYEREVANLFSDAADSAIALRLIKLLILGALAAAPRSFSAAELTALLLHRYSVLESAVNYEYIKDIMDKLLIHGAYLSAVEKDNELYFTIDLKADIGLLLEKKLAGIIGDLPPGDRRMIDELLPWIDEKYLPLKDLSRNPSRDFEVTWQNTERSGKVLFGNPADNPDEFISLEKETAETETDFILAVVPPAFSSADDRNTDNTWAALVDQFSDDLRRSLITWMPRLIAKSEEDLLRSAYAHLKLYEEYAADDSPTGRQAERQLTLLLNGEKAKVKELYRKIYFEGRMKAGSKMLSPAQFNYLPFGELVTRVAAEILKNRYPRHAEIHPLSEQVSGSLVQRTLDLLFSTELESAGLERGVKIVLENFIAPLGLIKKRGQDFILDINPKTSALTAEYLGLVPEDGKIGLEKLYLILRKGLFGLSKPAFQVLSMAAILSGAVSAYQGGKRLAPTQVNYYRFWNIEEIGPGTLIRPELQKVMGEVPFLPARLRSGPLTFAVQQQAWEAVIAFKTEWTGRLTEIRRRSERLIDHPQFQSLNWDSIIKNIDRFNMFLSEIKTSYASREGLERFLATCQSSPLYSSDWRSLSALDDFFQKDLTDVLNIAGYLQDDNLMIPEADHYAELRRRCRLISDLLASEPLIWEEKHRERLKREFEQFRSEYCMLYLAEHDREVGPERIKPYHEIIASEAYRLLENLGRINTLVAENDLVGINRLLSGILERECSLADEARLLKQAVCSCGFKLGETHNLPDRAVLEEKIIQSLRAYLKVLQADAIRQRLSEHAEHLELVGRRSEAEPLHALLRIDCSLPPQKLIAGLNKHVNNSTINMINRVLTGGAIIVERSIDELLEMLVGRVFNLSQLQSLLQDWLSKGEASPPAYIKVTQKESRLYDLQASEHPQDNDETGALEEKDFLEARIPRLLVYSSQVNLEQMYALAMLCGWLSHFNLEGEDADLILRTVNINGSKDRLTADLLPDLESLGLLLLDEKDKLRSSFMEKAAEKALVLVSAVELIELFLKASGAEAYSFETLLDQFVDEPFFPVLSQVTAARLATQINAEESLPRLNVICGMLREALRSGAGNLNGLNDNHRKTKLEALRVLQTNAECSLILHEAENLVGGPPENDKNWERFYRLLSPFERALGRLEEASARSLVPEVTIKRWRQRYTSTLDPLATAFSAHLAKGASARRQTLSSLWQRYPEWIEKERDLAGAYLVIVDGARLDVWLALIEMIMDELSFETLREGLFWADQPTVTEVQLQPLKDAGLLGHLLHIEDGMLAELVAEPSGFLSAINNLSSGRQGMPLKAVKFSFVDDKIHSSRDPLPQLLDELIMIGRKQLLPLFKYMPGGSLALLLADHGFRTNLYHSKADKSDLLYLHGGDTFFEVLTPWALLRKR